MDDTKCSDNTLTFLFSIRQECARFLFPTHFSASRRYFTDKSIALIHTNSAGFIGANGKHGANRKKEIGEKVVAQEEE